MTTQTTVEASAALSQTNDPAILKLVELGIDPQLVKTRIIDALWLHVTDEVETFGQSELTDANEATDGAATEAVLDYVNECLSINFTPVVLKTD